MSPRWTILVDVGNSAVKVAVVANPGSPTAATDSARNHATNVAGVNAAANASVNAGEAAVGRGGRPLQFLRLDLRDASWPVTLVEQSQQWFALAEESASGVLDGDVDSPRRWLDSPRRWVVASVNGPASRLLRNRIAVAAPADEWYELSHSDIPMRAELRNSAAIGIDRLLGASAAWHASVCSPPGTQATSLETDAAVISIDAGSAVTVDLVRAGVFMGGAILPGLRLQMASLTQGTDLLPAVTHEGAKSLEIPGRDTVSAMRTGVMLGLSGGIDRLIEKLSEGCSSSPHVFLTGGDAAALQPLLSHAVSRRDDLVLSAIADTAPALGDPLVREHDDGEVC